MKQTVLLSLITVCVSMCIYADDPKYVAFADSNSLSVKFDGKPLLELFPQIWGPNWKWTGLKGELDAQGGVSTIQHHGTVQPSKAMVNFEITARKKNENTLDVQLSFLSDKDTDLTQAIIAIGFGKKAKGKLIVKQAGGVEEMNLPLGRGSIGDAVEQLTLVDSTGGKTVIDFASPTSISCDKAARIKMAGKTAQGGQSINVGMSITFPAPLTFYASPGDVPDEPGLDQWFAWQPKEDFSAGSEIGMANWLEAPAGKHGRITSKGDKLIYNGKEIKLWGLNLCYGACTPDNALAEKRAEMYAKYGINSVRFHKFADGPGWAGIQAENSFTEFDMEKLNLMDYQIAKLKEKGIYVKLSAHFGQQKLGPDDEKHVPYLKEFGKFKGRRAKRIVTPASAVHYAKELQDLQIKQMVNLLKHKNPHTGLTYAEDPGIAFIEIINEQSILFFSSMRPLEASPTLRQAVAKRFCDWLRKKYGSHEGLVKAWGAKAIGTFKEVKMPGEERLDNNNVLPLGNPWFWDPDNLDGSQKFRKQRLLDSMAFLYELQNEFYDRYVAALRKAGYKGEIVSSNWQAGRAYSHFLNLHSDARIGTIDRHNYFGGIGKTMCNKPGSGSFSSGMQQVAGRPFMLSEWIHVYPNQFGVEGPAIIGAYGMGLQGWDVSYMFQNGDTGGFNDVLGKSNKYKWAVTSPQIMGVFPAVARQVLRQDVEESKLVAPRYVHVPSLKEGKLGFEDKVVQGYDDKSFDSSKVPATALAVAKCTVDYTDEYKETPLFPIEKHMKDGKLVSNTDQLAWKPGKTAQDGYFTIDSPGTKAVVGFAKGQVCKLGPVTIKVDTPFAAVYVVAKDPNATIRDAKELLIVAVARARNSGAKMIGYTTMLKMGKSPILMEPVKAEIAIDGAASVEALDQDGKKTGQMLQVSGGKFRINGATHKTVYYKVSVK